MPSAKTVTGNDGSVTPYDTLLLATGSSALDAADRRARQGRRLRVPHARRHARAAARVRPGREGVVIGGGLLGLEAARGLQVQGCDVTVVHLMPTLMERQLDPDGGDYLVGKMEELGIRVLLGRTTTAVLGNGHVEGVALSDDSCIDADLVVVAAGIRPNVDLAVKAGVIVNRGIVVNDYMETSQTRRLRRWRVRRASRRLLRPGGAALSSRARCWRRRSPGNRGPTYTGTVQAAKLKIMGVDVFSAGDWSEQNAEPVRYEDRALGIYKKLTVRDGKLAGVILVGDTSDSHRYMEWLRTDADLTGQRRHLLFPPPAADAGLDVAEMADSATVCGCVGVTKGTIIEAIHEQRRQHAVAAQGVHAGEHRLRQLHEPLPGPAARRGARVRGRAQEGHCAGACPFAEDKLRDILRSQRLKSVQEVLEIYGNGIGCEVCKPALSYMLDMLWCGDHDEDRSARFINDRVHANIQKDGTFSVIPRIRGGVTSPGELRRIADVAEKYQRADGEDHRQPADRSARHQEGGPAEGLGRPRHAVRPGVHEGRAHGEDVRRHGLLPLRHAGFDVSRHRDGATVRAALHAAQGEDGARSAARATAPRPRSRTSASLASEGGWQVVVGGAAGKSVRKADLLTTVETTEQALEASELFFQYYRENANYLERTYDFVERAGHREGSEGDGLRARRRQAGAARSSAEIEGALPRCLARGTDAEASDAVHPDSGRSTRCWHDGRIAGCASRTCDNIPPREGRAVTSASREIAIFNLGDRFLATDNRCPHRAGRSATASSRATPSSARCTPGRSTSKPAASNGPPGRELGIGSIRLAWTTAWL